ncbi:uncharacterized protein J3R85_001541 [Psidium guajava]|nr:uncharacterized protein J3R85_001541 [Psidium guajava]
MSKSLSFNLDSQDSPGETESNRMEKNRLVPGLKILGDSVSTTVLEIEVASAEIPPGSSRGKFRASALLTILPAMHLSEAVPSNDPSQKQGPITGVPRTLPGSRRR